MILYFDYFIILYCPLRHDISFTRPGRALRAAGALIFDILNKYQTVRRSQEDSLGRHDDRNCTTKK